MIGADLLIRRQRAGAEDRAEAAGELVRKAEARDELRLGLGKERDRIGRKLFDEVEGDAAFANRLADRLEGHSGGLEREDETRSAHVARTKRAAVLRRDHAELGKLLNRLLRRAGRDGDFGSAQVGHAEIVVKRCPRAGN